MLQFSCTSLKLTAPASVWAHNTSAAVAVTSTRADDKDKDDDDEGASDDEVEIDEVEAADVTEWGKRRLASGGIGDNNDGM